MAVVFVASIVSLIAAHVSLTGRHLGREHVHSAQDSGPVSTGRFLEEKVHNSRPIVFFGKSHLLLRQFSPNFFQSPARNLFLLCFFPRMLLFVKPQRILYPRTHCRRRAYSAENNKDLQRLRTNVYSKKKQKKVYF